MEKWKEWKKTGILSFHLEDILSKHTDCSWKRIARVEKCVGEFRRNFLASKSRRKSFFYARDLYKGRNSVERGGMSRPKWGASHTTRSWFHCTRNLNMDHCTRRQTRNRSLVSIERLIYSLCEFRRSVEVEGVGRKFKRVILASGEQM